MILLLSFVFSLHAYESVFQLQTEEQLHHNNQLKYENELLKRSCELEKRRGGFLWPCYLSSEKEMTSLEMSQDCEIKIKKVQSAAALPSIRQTLKLPKMCQKLISMRRQVLAYKAKGI